ncbi:MAG: preprotein translocase subunit SecE [Chloroflexi bacterium]|nr:preprotein translocase subunit SecE [Chloroflexota bacterium]
MSKRSIQVADEKKTNAITRYVRETTGELRKVSWPTRREALQLSAIVIAVMVVMGIYLSLVDAAGEALIKLALSAR